MGVCNQIPLLVLYYTSSRLVPLLEVINAPDIVDLTVSFKFLNFSFQICLLFDPEMSTTLHCDVHLPTIFNACSEDMQILLILGLCSVK